MFQIISTVATVTIMAKLPISKTVTISVKDVCKIIVFFFSSKTLLLLILRAGNFGNSKSAGYLL